MVFYINRYNFEENKLFKFFFFIFYTHLDKQTFDPFVSVGEGFTLNNPNSLLNILYDKIRNNNNNILYKSMLHKPVLPPVTGITLCFFSLDIFQRKKKFSWVFYYSKLRSPFTTVQGLY